MAATLSTGNANRNSTAGRTTRTSPCESQKPAGSVAARAASDGRPAQGRRPPRVPMARQFKIETAELRRHVVDGDMRGGETSVDYSGRCGA